MIWPFSILFEPIQKEIIESYPLKKKPDWSALSPLLADRFSIAGNLLPSKKIAAPTGKIFEGINQVESRNVLPSSKIGKIILDVKSVFLPGSNYQPDQHIEKFNSGCEFTMNYKNMFMVIPTVIMFESGNKIVVKYFYKTGVKALQYYWFGFCSFFLLAAFIFGFLLPISSYFIFGNDIIISVNGEVRRNDFFAYFSSLAFMLFIPSLLMGMALYFRNDLLGSARMKVLEFVKVLES